MSETIDTTQVIEAPTQLDSAVDQFIAANEAEFRAAALEPTATNVQAEDVDPAAPVEPVAPAPVAAKPAEPALDPTAAAIVKALAEDRERRRAEKQARKAQKAAVEPTSRPQIDDTLLARLQFEPDVVLEQLGIDPDMVVRKTLARKLGEKAPRELLEAIDKGDSKAQMRALEQKVMAQSRELAARDYFTKVEREAHSYVTTQDYSGVAPTVHEVAKRDPARVHAEVMREIVSDAQSRASKDPNGALMTYDTALSRLEQRWSDMKKVFIPAGSSEQANAGTINPSPAQVPEKPAPKVVKPPDRPLAPWLRRGPAEEEGLKAALDEWKRVESTKR